MTAKNRPKPKKVKIPKREVFTTIDLPTFERLAKHCKAGNQTTAKFLRKLIEDFFRADAGGDTNASLAELLFQMELLLRKIDDREERTLWFKRIASLKEQLLRDA